MQLIQRNKDSAYLQYDKYVNYDNPIVAAKAKELAADCKSSDEIIQACYYFVRDRISHTYDSNFSVITISASDVLEASTGISLFKGQFAGSTASCQQLIYRILLYPYQAQGRTYGYACT